MSASSVALAGEPVPRDHESGGGHVLEGRDTAAVWCSACHQISPALEDPGIGPPFMELSGRLNLTKDFIVDWIAHNHTHVMPDFHMPRAVREEIANYILSLRDPELLARQLDGMTPAARAPEVKKTVPYSIEEMHGSFSGFFVSSSGYLVTVAHGVHQCDRLTVHRGGRISSARLVALDDPTDVALLKSDPPDRVAVLGNDAELRDGLAIVSYGYPIPRVLSSGGVMGFGYVNATSGAMNDPEKMQIDIPAWPGSSGSPVFDRGGRVIGIITGRINHRLLAAEDQHFVANITFATKVSAIRRILAENGVDDGGMQSGRASLERTRLATARIVCDYAPS